ncbi:MAG: family 20 glycosylhydrolase [Janthinobacterium lividum]
MKKLLFLLFPVLVSTAFSQPKSAEFNPQNLEIKWEIIRNNDQGKAQTLSALTIINHDQNSLPASGWKLFFNFERMIRSVSGPVNSSYFNGDLFCFSPEKGFKTLKNGESFRTEIISADWVINKTDAPSGFYWINDQNPNQQISINNITLIPSTKPEQFLRDPTDLVPAITPEIVFNQNKNLVNVSAESLPPVFPTPVSYQYKTGQFLLDGNVAIQADAVFMPEKLVLQQLLSEVLNSAAKQNSTQKIILSVNKALAPEAYELKISSTQITILAADNAGIFYGIQSLKSMFPAEVWSKKQTSITLLGIEVKDAPRFGYRGLLIDVARNFQTKNEVLKVLDLMGNYKLNTLHLHLNDDEGWRLEISALPELTSVGSKRGHTLDSKDHLPPSYGSGPKVNNPYGSGFYTKADFVEILQYAKTRHITVIPEIETPGHARAAIKAMDARYRMLLLAGKKQEAERYLLHDLGDQSVYRSVQNWNDNVVDVSMPSTYSFLETVADEVIAIYKEADAPLKTIHFGGDEVPAGVWEKSAAYQKLRATHPEIKSTDDLWYYYFGKVNQLLKKRNLYASGWEEAGLRKTVLNGQKTNVPNRNFADQNFHLYVWNNVIGGGAEDLAYQLANAGYPVVLGNVTNLYFDMAYQKAFDEPGYYWGSYIDVDKPFKFIPYNYFKNSSETSFGKPVNANFYALKEALTEKGKANIVGIQGLLWAETVKGPERLEYMLLPKMLGLAERAWAKDPDWATEPDSAKSKILYEQAWSVFTNVLGRKALPRLSYLNGGFNYRIPTAGVLVENGQVKANVQFPGMLIRYTTDGSEPNGSSAVYTKPINQKGTLKFSVFNLSGRSGRVVSIINP